MDSGKFNIFEAVKDAYIFAGREWLYLLKAGLLPVIVQAGVSLFIQFQRPDASHIETYLWGLPATALFAWFTFVEMRLLLLGERLNRLSTDSAAVAERRHALQLTMILSLLFNMGLSALSALLLLTMGAGAAANSWALSLAGMFILGGIFWSLRFGIVPILASVHYPIRPVIQRTWGMMFSLRLIGMGMICLFPVAIVFQILTSLFVRVPADAGVEAKMSLSQQVLFLMMGAPLSLVVSALLNAAAAYALKQILGSRQNGVLA